MTIVPQNPDAPILEIRDQIAVLGSNDFEFDAIEEILKELHDHAITLDEAVSRTRAILYSKQDYR